MAQHDFLPSLFTRGGDLSRHPFSSLQGEIDRLFEAFGRPGGLFARGKDVGFAPSLDIAETPAAIDVTVELPGCEAKDVEISATGRTLSIKGEKKSESETTEKDWHVTERSYGAFQRSIPIPFDIDPAKVEARFDKGVLKIHLPKPAEAVEGKKTIAIKGE